MKMIVLKVGNEKPTFGFNDKRDMSVRLLWILHNKVFLNMPLNEKDFSKYFNLNLSFILPYFILHFFNISSLYGLSEGSSLHYSHKARYYDKITQDHFTSFENGHLKFQHYQTTLEIEHGDNSFGSIGDMFPSSQEINQRNGTPSDGPNRSHPFEHNNTCWGGTPKDYIKKNTTEDTFFNTQMRSLHDERPFSRYVNLNLSHLIKTLFGQTVTFFALTRGELSASDKFRRPLESFKKTFSEDTQGNISVLPKIGMEWGGHFVPLGGTVISFQPSAKVIAEPRKPIGNGPGSLSLGNLGRSHGSSSSSLTGINNNGSSSGQEMLGHSNLEEGNHALYGGKILTNLGSLGNMDFFLGQKYTLFKKLISHSERQEKTSRLSNYVGYLDANLFNGLMINSRVEFDRKSLHYRVSDVGGTLNIKNAYFSVNYTVIKSFDGMEKEGLNKAENKVNFQRADKQLNSFFSYQLTENFSFSGSLMQNLKKKKVRVRIFSYGARFNYHHENLGLGVTIDRRANPDMGTGKGLKGELCFRLTLDINSEGKLIYPMNGSMVEEKDL